LPTVKNSLNKKILSKSTLHIQVTSVLSHINFDKTQIELRMLYPKRLTSYFMKRISIAIFVFLPVIVFSQTILKLGGAVSNRWNETLNSQTLGKGIRISVEKFIIPQFAIGLGGSYFSFNPNKSINIRFNSVSLQFAYYVNTKKLQPYFGAGVGYTKYFDKTTIDLGSGINSTQIRNKNYGVISPYLGMQCAIGKAKKAGCFIQLNTDFVPVVNTDPIGFISLAAGLSYQLSGH
jgi:opacity protein-like surface antigen